MSVALVADGRARDIVERAPTDLADKPALRLGASLDERCAALPDAKEERHTHPTASGAI